MLGSIVSFESVQLRQDTFVDGKPCRGDDERACHGGQDTRIQSTQSLVSPQRQTNLQDSSALDLRCSKRKGLDLRLDVVQGKGHRPANGPRDTPSDGHGDVRCLTMRRVFCGRGWV